MATYEYVCDNTECEMERFEDKKPMSQSDVPSPCPLCGVLGRKVVSQVAPPQGLLPEFIDTQRPKYHREPPVRVSKVTQRSRVGGSTHEKV